MRADGILHLVPRVLGRQLVHVVFRALLHPDSYLSRSYTVAGHLLTLLATRAPPTLLSHHLHPRVPSSRLVVIPRFSAAAARTVMSTVAQPPRQASPTLEHIPLCWGHRGVRILLSRPPRGARALDRADQTVRRCHSGECSICTGICRVPGEHLG